MFTKDKSLYTNIPVKDAINSIKELVLEFDNVIPNAKFVVELLNVVLKQIFGGIMGTNFNVAAPTVSLLIFIWLNWKSYCGKMQNRQKLV